MDGADAKLLAAALVGNTALQTLTARYGVYMTNAAAAQLERALGQSCVVRAELFGRSYSHNGRRVVRDYREDSNATLRSLCVANAVRRVIANDPALVEIDWSNMGLEDDNICTLASSLHSNSKLQHIRLSNNRSISDQAVETLASALKMCACLRVDIDGCHRVSREAASKLRAVWVANTCRRVKADDSSLAEIDWSNTEAGDEDLCMLAVALQGTSTVNTVTVAHNRRIGDVGAGALQEALHRCAVVAVALDVTSVGEPLKVEIRRLCVANAVRRIAANDRGLVELDWRVMWRKFTRSIEHVHPYSAIVEFACGRI